jgi:hypothetical protein
MSKIVKIIDKFKVTERCRIHYDQTYLNFKMLNKRPGRIKSVAEKCRRRQGVPCYADIESPNKYSK